MNVFDEFIIGNTQSINWCFENKHFNQRLQDNGISYEFIKNTVMYEDPLRYEKSGKNEYAVIFKAPDTKKYSEIKVILACYENKIDLVTIMPNTNTNRQENVYKSENYKNIEKKRKKAISKRKGF